MRQSTTDAHRSIVLTIVVALLCSLALAGVPGVTADESEPTIAVEDATVDPSETASADVTISEAPDGLSGFNVSVSVDSDVAEITDATTDDAFALDTVEVADDGSDVHLMAVDLDREVGPSDEPAGLGTLEIEGVNPGETTLEVTVDAIDTDDGEPLDVATADGTVTVTGATDGDGETTDSESDGHSEGSASDDTDADGLAIEAGVLTGGLAVLLVTAVGLRLARTRR